MELVLIIFAYLFIGLILLTVAIITNLAEEGTYPVYLVLWPFVIFLAICIFIEGFVSEILPDFIKRMVNHES